MPLVNLAAAFVVLGVLIFTRYRLNLRIQRSIDERIARLRAQSPDRAA